jgi:lipoprotein-anchoring transpeptidase ErfK/SrfK
MRLAVLGIGILAAAAVAGCGGERAQRGARTTPAQAPAAAQSEQAAAAAPPRCTAVTERALTSARTSFAGFAPDGAVAYRAPGGAVLARFGRENVNGYPTYFAVLGKRVGADCRPLWYRVELPVRPNGAVGWVRAAAIELQSVDLRIEVDLSLRRLTVFRAGRRLLTATVAVGAPATPTPIGHYYVNQRLVPEDTSGPFGPGAIGISAFSPVLTGWAQGGPVAIHGTNEPWSIGHAVSNGCIRLPNGTLERLFRIVPPGTQVIIHP